jgi:hypothetical protein
MACLHAGIKSRLDYRERREPHICFEDMYSFRALIGLIVSPNWMSSLYAGLEFLESYLICDKSE